MSGSHDDLLPTRKSLIKRLKDWRDESSWQEFFDTYWNLIYGVARKAGLTDAEAQDVVQETMISVAKHMPGFAYDPAIGRFKSWLLKMTHWRIIDQFRKRGPLLQPPPWSDTTRIEQPTETVEPIAHEFEALWDAEWERYMLENARARVKRRISPQQYQLYDFYVSKEWPAEKVANQFGVSLNQVFLAKNRVGEMIKEELKRLEKEML